MIRMLRRVGEITRETLVFFKEQTEAKDFDSIDMAESALTLHAQLTVGKESSYRAL